MPAQYTKLDGRHWCNEDFVNKVRELYPATTKKIPLGYSTYTGWTGKDEVLFITHDPLDDLAHFEGQVYEITFDPSAVGRFKERILDEVKHTDPPKTSKKSSAGIRHRKTANLDQAWGTTLEEKISQQPFKKEARRGEGMYGFPKTIVSSCTRATRKLNTKAANLMHKLVQKDRNIVSFLQTHLKRSSSTAAQVLLASYKNSLPQVDLPALEGPLDKQAKSLYGMYGYPAKTASLGLSACSTIKEAAGALAADLHFRKKALYQRITSFLGEHNKVANCPASGLLLSCYPEEGFSFKRASTSIPNTVEGWLQWDPTDN